MFRVIQNYNTHSCSFGGIDWFIGELLFELAKTSTHSTAPVLTPEEADMQSFVDVSTNWI